MDENINVIPPQSHKLRTIIFIVTFICALGGVYLYYSRTTQTNNVVQQPQVKLAVELTTETQGKIPAAFPKDLITEKNIQVLDNYIATTSTGVQQSTFRYISGKNFKQNVDYFNTYLQKNKWSYVTHTTGQSAASLVYTKQSVGTLTIGINRNQTLQAYVVDITMEVLKK